MVDENELRSKARAVLKIMIGCIRIVPKQTDGIENRLNSLLISESFVKKLEKCSVMNQHAITLFEPIGSKAIEGKIQLFELSEPLIAHMNYSSDVIDPGHPYKKQDVNVTLLYDGLVYLAAIQEVKSPFNHRRHVAHLQRWLYDLLKKENSWETSQISNAPSPIWIDFYILKEVPDEFKGEKRWIGTELASKHSSSVTAWAVSGEDLSVQEAIGDEVKALYSIWMMNVCRNYYSAQILNTLLRTENNRATEMIGHIVDEALGFYDIPLLHLIKRFQKSRSLGKQLAQVYALMPNIEKIENEYNHTVAKLGTSSSFNDLDEALTELFRDNLETPEKTIFTRSVNEMLREDLSEIRVQINHQLLLLSAFITFIAVIIAALIK